MAAKTEFFSRKRSWIWTCSEISRKFRFLRKSATILNEASSYLYTLGNDIYTGKNSSTNIYLFRVNNSNTRKRREICSKLAIMSLQRRSTVFIVNFEYISYLFTPFSSVFTVGFEQLNVCWVPLYQFINVGMTYLCKYLQMYKNLSEMVVHKKGLWSEIVVPKNIFSL